MDAISENKRKHRIHKQYGEFGENTRHRAWLRSIKLLNAVMITIPFAVCWYCFYAARLYHPYLRRGNFAVVGMYFVLYIVFGKIYSAFTITLHRISELVYSQCLAITFSSFIIYAVTWLLTRHFPNPLPLLAAMVAGGILSVIWSRAAHQIYFSRYEPIPTLIIWDMRKGLKDLVESYGLDKRFKIIDTPNVWEVFKDPDAYLSRAGAVFLCGIHSHERNQIIKQCIARRIRVYVIPRVGDLLMESAHSMHMF
ncbi:MAG: sugar transferase, partial [Lachnospiraceae bacterium]|nr:sugar transferase [Lachnospiraceae bacterium]